MMDPYANSRFYIKALLQDAPEKCLQTLHDYDSHLYEIFTLWPSYYFLYQCIFLIFVPKDCGQHCHWRETIQNRHIINNTTQTHYTTILHRHIINNTTQTHYTTILYIHSIDNTTQTHYTTILYRHTMDNTTQTHYDNTR